MKDAKMKDIELRTITVEGFEVREDDDGHITVAGHAAIFDQPSVDLGGFIERVARGAFSKSLGGDVRALFNHDPSQILGRTKSRTLRVSEDQRGLAVEIDMPDTVIGQTVVSAIRRGDISEMSFGFRTIEDEWTHFHDDPNKLSERLLKEVELRDVSPVTFPAYPQTDIALRSLDASNAELESQSARPNLLAMRQRHADIA